MQSIEYKYKFTEEDFNKLPALSRIEYRQREEVIFKQHKFSATNFIFWFFMIIFGFLILLSVAGYGISRQFTIAVFRIIFNLVLVYIAVYILAMIGDYINNLKEKKKLKALKDSYFNFKVEVKKKNNEVKNKEIIVVRKNIEVERKR